MIAGGGVAGLEAALALRALAEDRVTIELLAPEPHFWYRPLAVAEPFGAGDVRRFELGDLMAAVGGTFSLGALGAVEAESRLVHTSVGGAVPYDYLLVACGTVPTPAIPGAITFRGPADVEKIARVLEEIAAGDVRRVAFAVPSGAVWSLPAYELALLTAAHLEAHEIEDAALALVTPEEEPLRVFGSPASKGVRRLLEARGVTIHLGAHPVEVVGGELRLVPDKSVPVDRVIALPRLRGPAIEGIPQTDEGFVPVDAHGRVTGLDDVFAVGDITTFPIKQGGIATQQADAAAEAIAAAVGADLVPSPFRPVLRGLLLTGKRPRYLRRELTGGLGETSSAGLDPLWWPPAKIVGRYLAPFLADFARSRSAVEG